jgi:hypothetical protein
MNAQDFRSLQEAYGQVYKLDEIFGLGKKKGTSPRADALINSDYMKKKNKEADEKAVQNLRDMMSKDKEKQKRPSRINNEAVDLYDIILSHLLDEGFADTQEQAEVIMVNMSEDWRESIFENVSSGKGRVTRYVQSKPTGPVTNRELDTSRQKRMDAENDRIKKIGDEAHAAATSKGLSFAEAEFRRKRAELRARKNS